MKNLILVGAGGYARELLAFIHDINQVEPSWNVLGFIDDTEDPLKGKRCPYSVLGTIKDWNRFDDVYFLMAIASPHAKQTITQMLMQKGARFISLIHPTATIAPGAVMGEGTVIYPYGLVGPDVTLGDHVTILTNGYVGHDSKVGSYTMISGCCGVNGYSTIGERVYIGSHATLIPHIKVADDAYIGIGSVVIRNVKKEERVFGNPAKKMV